jgi:superfamily II DNA/RNA helicase
VAATDKSSVLERILAAEPGKVLVFVNKKVGCEKLGNMLKRDGLPADAIHGDKGAEQRHVVLQAFARGKVRFLVATDVAARGIDVDDIDLVVNYDFPLGLEDYIHRTGRTGRAGRKGRAISLVAPSEKRMFSAVHGHLKGDKVEDGAFPSFRGRGAPRGGGGGGGRGRGGPKGGRAGGGRGRSRHAAG